MKKNADKLKDLKSHLIQFKQEEGDRPFDNDYFDEMIDIAVDCFKDDKNSNTSHLKVVKKK
ncbi:MAG: hypothetical protein GX857_08785 [Bacteroidales bacterium]|jgi:alpha-glucosidase (family GH31 glycosyl hydrolase)|nr:hypothetical protein [Bacteroidales bacterium]